MKINSYKIMVPNQYGKRVFVMSDLHIAGIKEIKKLEVIVDYLAQKRDLYDLIIIAGDLFDATNVIRENKEVMLKLSSILLFLGKLMPIYIASGSHDLARNTDKGWVPDEDVFRDYIAKVSQYEGIRFLDNATEEVGNNYTISIYNPSLPYAINTPDGLKDFLYEQKDYKFLNKLDENFVNILVCHYPNAIIELDKMGLLKNVNFSVAGHNHSGVIPQFKLFPVGEIMDKLGFKNQGLITPGKSIKIKDNMNDRGLVELSSKKAMLVNPAVTTLADCTGILSNFDLLFCSEVSSVSFVTDTFERIRRK